MSNTFSAYEGNAPYVFISYSHEETDIVLPVVRELAARGVRVWYDGGLEAGTEWPEIIARHLLQSSCVLAFVSGKYCNSHNCRRELDFAIAKHKDPVVVYLEAQEKLSAGIQMQLVSLSGLFYDHYIAVDGLVDALMETAVVRACIAAEETEETPSEPQTVPFDTIEFTEDGQTLQTAEAIDPTEDVSLGEMHTLQTEESSVLMETESSGCDQAMQELFDRALAAKRDKRYQEAIALFRAGANQGHAGSMFQLGECYKNGLGVSQNYTEGLKWYLRAAEHGSKLAHVYIGYCYYNGNGADQSYAEALKWFLRARELGMRDRLTDLAIRRCEKALKKPWWKK